MTTIVKPRLQSFGKAISKAEVGKLKTEVGQVPDRDELSDLKSGRSEFLDKFSTTSLRDYDRFVGQFRVVGGEVRQYYLPYSKQWKVDASASYRKRWGVSGVDDPKAPTFEKSVAPSAVPASIRKKFAGFAEDKRAELKAKNQWPNHDPATAPRDQVAWQLYDRQHHLIGYVVRERYQDGKYLESHYRKDGTPVLWDTSDRPYD